jgi:hypothetical protein
MKKAITLIILFIGIVLNVAQPLHASRLDDIEDKLDEIQDQMLLDQIRRNQELESRRQYRPQSTQQPYKNMQPNSDRVRLAKFWGLSMSEYLRRDEIGSVSCDKYLSNGGSAYILCYYSKMLNISYTETEIRWGRVLKACRPIAEQSKKNQCTRDILVLNR